MNYLILTLSGAMLGLSVGIVFISLGKVVGISGISDGVFRVRPELWKVAFLIGLISVGALLQYVSPSAFSEPDLSIGGLIIGGLLVGFGTRLSNGCTCGHGICGNARFSKRSIVATLVFISTGAITVFLGGLV